MEEIENGIVDGAGTDNAGVAAEADVSADADAADTAKVGESTFVVDDSLLERAVKAGMSIADAKALPSKEFAEHILGALENARGKESAASERKDGGNDDNLAADFSGFSEEDGYDPTLVRAFNSLKALVERQGKELAEYRAGKAVARKANNIESRRNLTIARPGGQARNAVKVGAQMSDDDIVNTLFDKFTK